MDEYDDFNEYNDPDATSCADVGGDADAWEDDQVARDNEGGNENHDEEEYDPDDDYEPLEEEEEPIDGVGFANEGSALRRATPNNPRIYSCPTCGRENVLTRIDVQRGYQCDACADAAEGKL